MELKPCPFCGNTKPKTWWDFQPSESEEYWEGYNIACCHVHLDAVYKDEAIESWNSRSYCGPAILEGKKPQTVGYAKLTQDLRKLVERMENLTTDPSCVCEWCMATRTWKVEIKKLLEVE